MAMLLLERRADKFDESPLSGTDFGVALRCSSLQPALCRSCFGRKAFERRLLELKGIPCSDDFSRHKRGAVLFPVPAPFSGLYLLSWSRNLLPHVPKLQHPYCPISLKTYSSNSPMIFWWVVFNHSRSLSTVSEAACSPLRIPRR